VSNCHPTPGQLAQPISTTAAMQQQKHMVSACLVQNLFACLLLAELAASVRVAPAVRGPVGHSFIRTLAFQQRLRICNAYPYDKPLDIFVAKENLTAEEGPLQYKSCREFKQELRIDDEVDFKIGSTSAGTFTISALPSSDAVLLLVIYRANTLSTAVSFESHVFASLKSPQIAVMDLYKGTATSELRIQDNDNEGKPPMHLRSELLRYNNVVAVDPGLYQILLRDTSTKATEASETLVAERSESYVIIRCGVEAQLGNSFPQDLMLFPLPERDERSAATHLRHALLAVLPVSLAFLAGI